MAIFLGTSLLFFFFFSWSLIVSLLSFFVVFFFSFVPLSLNYYLNMCYFDSLSYFMCILSLWVGLMMISSSYGIYKTFLSNGVYSFLILSLVYILLLSFLVNNMLSFYFFFECSLIPTFLIIMGWGYQPERLQASVYLLFYTLFASLPLLVVIILMDKIMGSLTLCLVPCMVLSEGLIGGIFMFFTIFAFLVKMPLYIFHMWLPKAHVEAPVAGSMILAGVLLKLGGYGIYRMSFYFIYYYKLLSHYLLSLSLMSMVVVGFICCRMNDLKALVAYSSVSHMGLVLAGVITFSLWGMSGGFAMMVAHGLCSSGLFCLINMFYERFSTRSIFLIKGMSLILPSLTLLMFLLMMSNMAAPPTINLLSEILLMYSILDYSWMILLVFPLGSFLGAVFSIFMFSFSQHGKFSLAMASVYLSTPRELHLMVLHLFPINFLILFGGLLLF